MFDRNISNNNIVTLDSAITNAWSIFLDNKKYYKHHVSEDYGIPTGFSKLDEIIGCLRYSDLILVAARRGMGTTSFVMNIASNIAINEKKAVGIFSLDESAEETALRIFCSTSGVDRDSLKKGFACPEDYMQITKAQEILHGAPIYIVDSPDITNIEVKEQIKYMCREYSVECIIFDYLQLIRTNRNRFILDMKQLAAENDVPVIIVSKVPNSIDNRPDRHPAYCDLKGIGHYADVILFLYRQDFYDTTDNCEENDDIDIETSYSQFADVVVHAIKNRFGEEGKAILSFDKYNTRFENTPKTK